jgi:hypothetical protein
MKKINRKYLVIASILTGLLLFAACNDSLFDNSGASSAQVDSHDMEAASKVDSGYEWITVFNEDGTMENIRVPVVESKITEAERAQEAVRAAEVDTVRIFEGKVLRADSEKQNADSVMRSKQGIGILILGDGFTSAQQAKFIQSALDVYNHLISTYPFDLFEQNITLYVPQYISAESGVSRDYGKGGNQNGSIVNNYFGSTFYFDGKTDRLLYVKKSDTVEAARKNFQQVFGIDPAMTIILANSETYGGGGGNYAVASLHSTSRRIATHEIGHSLGRLADEYFWQGSEAPNMTKTNNAATVRWSSWVGFNGIGVYPYDASDWDGNPNQTTDPWYRPSQNCHMRALYNSFCAVCSSELTRIMADKTEPITITNRTTSGVTVPAIDATPVRAITRTSQYTGNVSWSPNHSTFAANTQYTATITLIASPGFTFQGVPANSFTVAGATSVTNPANSGVVRAVFPATFFFAGAGTPDDPYLIENGSQFKNIALYSSSNFKLVYNINLSGDNMAPLPAFHGVLDGNGKMVSYSQVVGNAGSYGLFSENFGLIQNMKVTVYIQSTIDPTGMVYVGGIAGKNTPGWTPNTGKIVDCKVYGRIIIEAYGLNQSANTRYPVVGGIAGQNTGIISGCSYGSGIASWSEPLSSLYIRNGFLGGIVGRQNGGSTTDCTNYAYLYVNNPDSYFSAGQIIGCQAICGVKKYNFTYGGIRQWYN